MPDTRTAARHRATKARFKARLKTALLLPCALVAGISSVASPSDGAVTPAASTGGHHRGHAWYVSKQGNDSAHGTQRSPFATLQRAADVAKPGDVINIRGGVYHQTATVYQDHVGIRGVGKRSVIFDGAKPVRGFVQAGSTWVRHRWHVHFDHSPTFTQGAPDGTGPRRFVNPAHPMAAWPDQVWIDGQRLAQVPSGSRVGPHQFAVDYGAHELIIGTNPSGRLVEASRLSRAISIRGAYDSLTDVTVRRYADSVPTLGAVTIERPHVTLRRVHVDDNATSGLLVSADYARILHSSTNRNGLIGIHGTDAYHLRLSHVQGVRNNLQRFNQAPVAGGIKMTRTRHIRIAHSNFSRNLGTGIWLDESSYDINLVGNRTALNTGHGINLEISDTAVVVDNLVVNNAMTGIQANNTGHVQIWNNSLVGNSKPINIVQDQRLASNTSWPGHDPRRPLPDPTVPWITRNVRVANNIITRPNSASTCFVCVIDATHRRSGTAMHVHVNGNLYGRTSLTSPAWVVVWSAGPGNPYTFRNLRDLRHRVGQELHGKGSRNALITDDGLTMPGFGTIARGVAMRIPADVLRIMRVTGVSRHLGIFPR